jgi:5-bromo-4-chloroindolyl phosphate hydrolysis protein
MAKMVKKSVAPTYLVAALWAAWVLVFPLYAPAHYIMAAVASVLVYVIAKSIFPDKAYETAQAAPKAEPEKKAKAEADKKSTGNPELDKVVEQGALAAAEMRRLNDSIKGEKISAQIDHLEDVTAKIIAYVADHPHKLSQISKFLNFYLPTTLKLLNAYDRMDDTGISGANIDGTMGKIDAMMDTVVTAFDKQLDALFGDEALDISTDITVMENLMAQEGLGGMQMESPPK